MNEFDDNFIHTNTALLLSQCKVQSRYVPEKPQNKPQQPSINDNHKKILMALFNGGQYKLTVTQACKAAGFPAGTGSRIIEACVKRNLIKIIQVPFGRGRPKYPILLSDGYALLGVKEQTHLGRGAGYEHTLYQHLIAEHFKELKPVIELNRNGKFIDVAIEANEFLICIEIAMTSVNEKINIEKDIHLAKADVVIIACINEKVKNEVVEMINEFSQQIKNKVIVMLIPELLKMKPEKITEFTQPHLPI